MQAPDFITTKIHQDGMTDAQDSTAARRTLPRTKVAYM